MNDQQPARKAPEPILPEPPMELIQQLAANMPFVALNLRRRNGRGGMGFVAAMTVTTTDLGDGTLENVLAGEYGGGEYHVRALNPENKMEQVIPTYSTSVDGLPKTGTPGAPQAGLTPREVRQQRLNAPAVQHAAPVGVIPGQPFFQPSHLAPAPVPEGRAFMQRLPDEIASEQAEYLRGEVQQLTQKFEEQQRQANVRIETLRAENDRLRLEQRDREIAHEKALQDARFRDLELKLLTPQKPAFDVTAIVGFVTALVPVFTAMVNASKDRAALMVSQQTEASKLQMEGIKTMLTAQSKKPDFDLKELVTLATPIVTAFISGRDPAKMAELMQTMGENQLGLLSMVGTMVNNMAGESEHPMMRIVQEAIAGAVSVAEKMAQARETKLAPQQVQVQARPLPPAAPTTSAPAPAPTSAPSQRRVAANAPSKVVEAPPSPDEIARMLLADPGWPPAMRGPAWQVIMRDVHDPAAPVNETALALGRALDALYDAGRLPSQLAGIFDGDAAALPALAQELFDALPVSADKARAAALAAALVQVFTPEPDDVSGPAPEANGAGHDDDDEQVSGPDEAEAEDDVLPPAQNA